jgi:hypothetical protein
MKTDDHVMQAVRESVGATPSRTALRSRTSMTCLASELWRISRQQSGDMTIVPLFRDICWR